MSLMLRTVLACTLLVFPLVACAVEDGEDVDASESDLTGAVARGASLTTTTRVNLRRGPSTRDAILRTLAAGEAVTAVEPAPQNGFYKVNAGGQEGWAHGAYLKAASGASVAPNAPADSDVAEETAATPAPGSLGVDQGGAFDGREFRGQTVLYQGDWSFLVRCDSYSRSRGRVVFACNSDSTREFVDDGAWIAMPSAYFTRGHCGDRARLCKGSSCVVAKIVERSVTGGKWEASKAVQNALGTEVGWSSCTRSFGTTTGVTITLE